MLKAFFDCFPVFILVIFDVFILFLSFCFGDFFFLLLDPFWTEDFSVFVAFIKKRMFVYFCCFVNELF